MLPSESAPLLHSVSVHVYVLSAVPLSMGPKNSAVPLSMGPKKSHGTDAVAKSSREIQNERRPSIDGTKIPRHRWRRPSVDGTKKSHGTDAVAKSSREIQNRLEIEAGFISRRPSNQGREIQTWGWRCREGAARRGGAQGVQALLLLLLSHAKIFCALLFCVSAGLRQGASGKLLLEVRRFPRADGGHVWRPP